MRRVRVSQQIIQLTFVGLLGAATTFAAPPAASPNPPGKAKALAAANAASAAPSGPVGPWAVHSAVPYPITSDTVRDRTDFSATYRRGSENFSLHILYIRNKLDSLETLKNAAADGSAADQAWKDGVKDMIGPFCLPSEKPDDCYDRYVVVQARAIEALKVEIKRHHLNVAELHASKALSGGRSPASGAVEPSPALPVSVASKGIQVPYRSRPMSYAELQEYYTQEAANLEMITKPEYEEWAKSLVELPALDGFVKLKKKTSLEGADQYELDRSCGNEICYDEKAFRQAVDDFGKKADASGKTQLQKLEDARVDIDRNKAAALAAKRTISSLGSQTGEAFSAASQAIEDASRKQSKANPTKAVFISIDPDTSRIAADPEAMRIP